MFKLLTDPDTPFLIEGDYVHFIGDDWTDFFKNNVFIVKQSVQTKRDKYIGVLAPNGTKNINPEELEPEHKDSLFEVRVGIKPESDYLLYMKFPAAQYRLGLEQPTYIPTPGDTDFGYVGHFDSDDTPWATPKLEMFFTDGKYPQYAAWNPSPDYAKLVLRFIVNMMVIEEVKLPTAEQKRVSKRIYAEDALRW